MNGFAGILRDPADPSAAGPAAVDAGGEDRLDFWIELPRGYFPLPLDDIDTTLAAAEANLLELAPEGRRPLVSAVVDTFAALLEQLQERNTAYCGLGWHTAEDGAVVPSSLVISLQQFPERRNPRLVLRDLVQIRAEAGEHGQVDLVDLKPGPALFFESVLTLPRPRIPGRAEEAADTTATEPNADVYQLQALVPSPDGTKLAAIDFTTPDIPHGPRFRAMMVLMADSVSFTAAAGAQDAGNTARSIGRILGGLAP
ncbi:MAG TPA: hypothetical protein VGS97_24985 [Actinocrinis sp.]|uniref:hypothetical protein n=1 Tax=Actinocrinis sp. TaxID=1920516 RepID=UPI002DDD3316|nr:hypothetical protein [Actinocrinis sp.]HEV2347374.1 hypothetical protein [Actinocrinis sp.]